MKDIMKKYYKSLENFYGMFPTYDENRIPMLIEYDETKTGNTIELVAPGYELENFDLYSSEGDLMLDLKDGDITRTYHLLTGTASSYDLINTEATYKNGVFTLVLKKHEPLKIQIKVS